MRGQKCTNAVPAIAAPNSTLTRKFLSVNGRAAARCSTHQKQNLSHSETPSNEASSPCHATRQEIPCFFVNTWPARGLGKLFSLAQRHKLTQDGQTIQTFDVQLTELQRKLVALLGVPYQTFRSLA